MGSYSNLLQAFEALNERKRWNPKSITQSDWEHWMEMRREIEKVLFNAKVDLAKDSRKFLRVPVNLKVRLLTQSGKMVKEHYISVLGEGGIFISTVDPLPVGSRLMACVS